MKFDDIIDKRRSVRKFYSKKPNWRDIIEAIDAGRRGPLAGNVPGVKFILIDDVQKIADLAEAADQNFVADCHFVVAVVSDTSHVTKSYDDRGKKYALEQSGAAIENVLLKLVDLKLATCWVGAFADAQVNRILKVPKGSETIALLPVGYARLEGKHKRKPPLDRCLYFNEYGERFMKPRVTVEGF